MKTLREMVAKAVQIAAENPKAVVGVFCDWKDARDIISQLEPDGVVKIQSREVSLTGGGLVKFIQLFDGDMDHTIGTLCGAQFSHIFNWNISSCPQIDYLRSRLRSKCHFREPMGYYNMYGVLRYENY